MRCWIIAVICINHQAFKWCSYTAIFISNIYCKPSMVQKSKGNWTRWSFKGKQKNCLWETLYYCWQNRPGVKETPKYLLKRSNIAEYLIEVFGTLHFNQIVRKYFIIQMLQSKEVLSAALLVRSGHIVVPATGNIVTQYNLPHGRVVGV